MERKFTQQGKWVIVLVKCIINFFVYRKCCFLIHKTEKLENGKLGYYSAFERHCLQIIPLSSHLQDMMPAGTEWTSGQQWKDSTNPDARREPYHPNCVGSEMVLQNRANHSHKIHPREGLGQSNGNPQDSDRQSSK